MPSMSVACENTVTCAVAVSAVEANEFQQIAVSLTGGPGFERQLRAIRQWVAIDIQHHRNHIVVTDGADEIDHAALAEFVFGGFECGVADLLGFEQLAAEVVDDLFVGIHRGGALARSIAIDRERDSGRTSRRRASARTTRTATSR